MERRADMKAALMAGLLLVLYGGRMSGRVFACSMPADPKIALVAVEENEKSGSYTSLSGGEPQSDGCLLYTVEEGTSMNFLALWDVTNQPSVRLSDSQWVDLSSYKVMVTGRESDVLVPLDVYYRQFVNTGGAYPLTQEPPQGDPELPVFLGKAKTEENRVKYAVFRPVLLDSSDPAVSFSYSGVGGLSFDATITLKDTALPFSELGPVETSDVSVYAETIEQYMDTDNEYPLKVEENMHCLAGLPTAGKNVSISSTREVTVIYSFWHPKAGWKVKDVAMDYQIDAGGLSAVGVKVESGGGVTGVSEDHAYAQLDGGPFTINFLQPSDPLAYEIRADCKNLLRLEDGYYFWYEVERTRASASDPWSPTDEELQQAVQDLKNQIMSGSVNVEMCGCRVYGLRFTDAMSNPSYAAGKVYVRVLDKTPPSAVDVQPAKLVGTCGEPARIEGGGGDKIVVTVLDNNPYVYFHDSSSLFRPGGRFDGDVWAEFLYTTQIYDYTILEGPSWQDVEPRDGNGNCMSVWKPTAKWIWVKACDDSGNTHYSPVSVSIMDASGSDVSGRVDSALDDSVLPLLSAASNTSDDPAYAVLRFEIPVSDIREPLPLHYANVGACVSQDAADKYRLKYMVRVCDGSGNVYPLADWNRPAGGGTWDDVEGSPSPDDVVGDADNDETAYSPRPEGGVLSDDDGNQLAFVAPDEFDGVTVSYPGSDLGTLYGSSQFQRYGHFEVSDDEAPQVFLLVTDTKYDKTYRFGVHWNGDSLRDNVTGGTVWPDDRNTRSSVDLGTIGGLRTPGKFFTDLSLNFSEPFGDYASFDRDAFKPSLDCGRQGADSCYAMWVEEDTRLLFRVVCYDNLAAGDLESGSNPYDWAARLDAHMDDIDSDPYLDRLEWTIFDGPTEGGVIPDSDSFRDEYIFRNPNSDGSSMTGDDCYTRIVVGDKAGNETELTVHYLVVPSKMRIRSLEENRKRMWW